MKKIWAWLKKAFKHIKTDVDKVAISITENIKQVLDSGTVGFLAEFIDKELHSHVGLEVVGILKLQIPKILAVELAIQGLPDNATEQDILDFENRILEAFGLHRQKDKFYTVFASQVYQNIKALVDSDNQVSFAQAVQLIEKCYQDYLKDKELIHE